MWGHLTRCLRAGVVAGQSSQDQLRRAQPRADCRARCALSITKGNPLVRGSRAQPANLVFNLQLAFLEAADRVVIGVRPRVLLDNGMLERRMLGLQRFDVVHSAHRRPPSWLRTAKTLTPWMPRVTPESAASPGCA